MLGCIFYKISVFVDKCIGKYLSSITGGTGKFWGGGSESNIQKISISVKEVSLIPEG